MSSLLRCFSLVLSAIFTLQVSDDGGSEISSLLCYFSLIVSARFTLRVKHWSEVSCVVC